MSFFSRKDVFFLADKSLSKNEDISPGKIVKRVFSGCNLISVLCSYLSEVFFMRQDQSILAKPSFNCVDT